MNHQEYKKQHGKTIDGFLTNVYSNQRNSNRRRFGVNPDYSLDDLREWAYSNEKFMSVYGEWEKQGYGKDMKPKIIRVDLGEPYSILNIACGKLVRHDVDELVSLRKAGGTNKEIGEALNIPLSTVSRLLTAKGYRQNAKRGIFTNHKRIYRIHQAMMQRCYSESYKGFKYYGAKGITVDEEWHDNVSFLEWSLEHGYEDHLTIDRIDETKGYSPDNCQWITQHEQILKQNRNKGRSKDSHHIYENGNRFIVEFIVGTGKNRVVKCRQYCTSFEEAVKHRDHFAKYGKELEFDNGYTPKVSAKKLELQRRRRRELVKSRVK